jgi:hypothetical protein
MNITIKTIQHSKQRYDTCGDWWFDKKGNLQIRVSDMDNWKYEYLVGDHEVREALLCKDRGITQKEVDKFDMNWKEHGMITEVGNDPSAPYYKEHKFSTKIEMMTAKELKVNWDKYDKKVNGL